MLQGGGGGVVTQIMRWLNARNGVVLDDGILVQHHADLDQVDGV